MTLNKLRQLENENTLLIKEKANLESAKDKAEEEVIKVKRLISLSFLTLRVSLRRKNHK